MNLKIEDWKYFKLGELFEYSTSDDDYLSSYEKGDTEYISSTAENNGIAGMIKSAPSQQKNTLTIARNGSVGSTFYHSSQYCASSDDVRILTPKFSMNKYTGLFISTLINKEKYKFSYGRKLTKNKVLNMEIRLPVNKNGDPNWEYMENYIKSLHHKPITTKNKQGKYILNTDKWEEFKIGNLFLVKLSKGDIKLDNVEKGEIPLISSGETNNGLIGYISRNGDGKAEIFEGNRLTIDMFCNAFYQSENFYSVSHGRVNILESKFKLNKYIGLFISTIISKEQFKRSYGRAVYSNESKNMVIKLPILRDGNGKPIIDDKKSFNDKGYIPDREFMENYIKDLPYGDRI